MKFYTLIKTKWCSAYIICITWPIPHEHGSRTILDVRN